jgi:hypothetical protein
MSRLSASGKGISGVIRSSAASPSAATLASTIVMGPPAIE